MAPARVTLCEQCILGWAPQPDAPSALIEQTFQQVRNVTRQIGPVCLLLDYSLQQELLSFGAREQLQQCLTTLAPDLDHVAICTGSNSALQVDFRFILAKASLRTYSLHETRQEALSTLRQRGEPAPGKAELARIVIDHLIEMSSGTCSVDRDDVIAECDPTMRAILAALVYTQETIATGELKGAEESVEESTSPLLLSPCRWRSPMWSKRRSR